MSRHLLTAGLSTTLYLLAPAAAVAQEEFPLFRDSGITELQESQESEPADVAPAELDVDLSAFPEATMDECVLLDNDVCVRTLLARGVGVDTRNLDGLTPLYVAIGADSIRAARALLAAGADREAITSRGAPAAFALAAARPEMLLLFVETPEMANELLLRAVRSQDLYLLDRALSLNADPDATDASGMSALTLAISLRHRRVASVLIAKGASVSPIDGSDTDPLGVAILAGDMESIALLLSANADPNADLGGLRPLHLATMQGDREIVEQLIRAGADVEIRSVDGVRPADFAAALGLEEITGRLGGITQPDVNDILSMISRGATRKEVRAALEAGADPNSQTPSGLPAVVAAAAAGRGDIVVELQSAGADITATTTDGSGALAAALSVENEQIRRAVATAVLRAADTPATSLQILSQRDKEGRSAAVLLAARLVARNADGQIYDAIFESATDAAAMREVALRPDPDGVSPYLAAVLSDNYQMTRYFAQTLALPPPQTAEGTSLQEIARSRGAWAAFAALPSDRPLPDDLAYGASESAFGTALRDMQAYLKDWGYYPGEVDGQFGPGSITAMRSFFLDREAEILAVSRAVTLEGYSNSAERISETNGGTARWRIPDDCDWWVVRKPENSGTNSYVKKVICFRENSTSVRFIVYGNGSDTIIVAKDIAAESWRRIH